jgi:hypothetical protein
MSQTTSNVSKIPLKNDSQSNAYSASASNHTLVRYIRTDQLGFLCVFLYKCLKGAGIVPVKSWITRE